MKYRSLRSASRIAFVALAALGMATVVVPAHAGTLTFDLNTVFNGATPTSTPPWLTATFNDTAANTVTLTLTSNLNVSSEFIDGVAFNVNPAFTPSALTIIQLTGPTATIGNTTDDAQNLNGGGNQGKDFDVLLGFPTAPPGSRFNDSDVATFTITATGLTAAAFNFTNTPADDLFIAAHVQGIPVPGGGTTSGAITAGAVPEPSGMALLGIGIVATAAFSRRRRAAT